MFESVVIANRGEIAVRIMRTLRSLSVRGVALYSDADTGARHVREADEALRLGPASPRESYLHIERVIDAALRAGADALHPGYGFLAESTALAEACAASGIAFIGPSPAAIALMGDKIRARATVAAAGVPIVPGAGEPGMSDADLCAAALEIGLPVLLKPSAGGGGKGMRLVADPARLASEVAASRREAMTAFGDDTLLVERFVTRPRHIEIQVAADSFGEVVHFGERECSLQRRHQKIIEEAPSPFVDADLRAAMGAQAVAVARVCGYTSVGTVELIVAGDRPDDFFFMEMNTRLQVEHPVTEAVYDVDLVEVQLRIAAGERLPWRQADLVPSGHAMEARVYAEDPGRGFLPTGGTVRLLREPDRRHVRVDSGLQVGTRIGSDYDPMLAKVIATADHREEAIDRLRAALADTVVLGVTTNTAFLRDLLGRGEVRRGELDTGLVDRVEIQRPVTPDVIPLAAWLLVLEGLAGEDVWSDASGWRMGGRAWVTGEVDCDGQRTTVRARRAPGGWLVAVGEAEPGLVGIDVEPARLTLRSPTGIVDLDWVAAGATVWLATRGSTHEVAIVTGEGQRRTRRTASGDGTVTSPMPGRVVTVLVDAGDRVAAGQPLAVVEAMKMEHTLNAPFDGVVVTVHSRAGDQVAIRQPIATIEVHEQESKVP
jgi:acetyl-CoA/propionyl-CoA carboxylase biotin carboxyl carrier protein